MSKGQKPMVGARVPHSWKDQIQSICNETGKSESEVVQEAIAQYLGQVDVNSVTSLNKRVAALERQYQKLVKLV
ncbi:MAG: ribbon-helix-helix domain-containing protein [Tildeniella nuda ZEHNDER 1965/U140]|jgi:RHH-type rel operon transcriptional repressor/antitoxin RelB|nr:ribbon-helix-helix domain-containing protein [Tildeniella nuda ZEHNDER 1965/U140]